MSMASATTMAGYAHVAGKRVRHRDRILDALDDAGAHGLTASELKAYFPDGTPDGSIGGRINELEDEGLIFRAGDERIYPITGCSQWVIRLARFSATPITPIVKPKKNPFLEGLLRAAKVIAATDPSFKGSPAALALRKEIEKIARR